MTKKKEIKNLLTFLEEQKPEEIIYVGTTDGTNWLVIDAAENIIRDIDEINKQFYREAVTGYKRNKNEVFRIPRTIVELQDDLEFAKDDAEVKKINGKMEAAYKRFITAYNSRDKYYKQVRTWEHFKDRDVIDIYDHETTDPGVSVIIKGVENGKFWTKKEYEKAKNEITNN